MLAFSAALALALPALQSDPPVLIADIEATPSALSSKGNSDPEWLRPFGSDLLMSATDGYTGRGLWHLNGTTLAPTALTSGNPSPPAVLTGGVGVFTAGVFSTVSELWRTDGTPAGTLRLELDVAFPGFESRTEPFLWMDRAWFVASTDAQGPELWSTDGTVAGTQLEFEVAGGTEGFGFTEFFEAGGKLFFHTSAKGETRLYALDSPGATPVDLSPFDTNAFSGGGLTALSFQGKLWYSAFTASEGAELWSSDGTPGGTGLFLDVRPGTGGSTPAFFAADASRLWFRASSPGVGSELWVSDGTVAGTQLTADLRPGPNGSIGATAGALTASGDLVFTAKDGPSNLELYVSDGTPGGTGLLREFVPGTAGGNPTDYSASGGQVYFAVTVPGLGRELWITDGTPAGTLLVQDVYPGGQSSDPQPLAVVGNRLYFGADDGQQGRELWSTRGVSATTAIALDLAPEQLTASAVPNHLVRLGDRVIFQARTEALGAELWTTDGTSAGTTLVRDIIPGTEGSSPRPLLALGSKVLMTAETPGEGREPWVTDGTLAGTQMLLDIFPGPVDSMARDFVPLGSIALFTAFVPGLGYAIFRTDGTPAGTLQLTTTALDFPSNVLTDSAVLDDRLIFSASAPGQGFEVWTSDGTVAGTALLADIASGSASSVPTSFETFGDHVYFSAARPDVGLELFRTDGTAGGTQLFADLVPGMLGGSPAGMTALEDRFVFRAGQNFLDIELWSSDGTVAGTGLVLDLSTWPSVNSTTPRAFKRVGDRAAFIANSGVDGSLEGVWITDGTAAGTEQILLGAPEGFVGNDAGQYQFLGGSDQLLFTARSLSTGWELWSWSGTGNAPQLLPEVWAGVGNSFPNGVIELGGQVIFSAYEPVLGSEMYSLDLLQFGTFGVEAFGSGCSNGSSPSIGFSGSAQLGQTLSVELEGAAPGALALAFYDADLALTDFGAGCTVYLAAPRLLGVTSADASGAAAVAAGIPAVPALVGMDFGIQWVTAEVNGPLLGAFGLTDALEIVPAL